MLTAIGQRRGFCARPQSIVRRPLGQRLSAVRAPVVAAGSTPRIPRPAALVASALTPDSPTGRVYQAAYAARDIRRPPPSGWCWSRRPCRVGGITKSRSSTRRRLRPPDRALDSRRAGPQGGGLGGRRSPRRAARGAVNGPDDRPVQPRGADRRRPVRLTYREFELLCYLAARRGGRYRARSSSARSGTTGPGRRTCSFAPSTPMCGGCAPSSARTRGCSPRSGVAATVSIPGPDVQLSRQAGVDRP